VRAFLENNLGGEGGAVKLWYAGPMFATSGRRRAASGSFTRSAPRSSASRVPRRTRSCSRWSTLRFPHSVSRLSLQINSLGTPPAARPFARRSSSIPAVAPQLCENCRRRLDINPLRILDCKAEGCRALRPGLRTAALFSAPCREHFAAVRALLDAAAVPHVVNPRWARLDYYTRTTFELTSSGLGAQDTVAAGGRYDRLVEEFGGVPTPGLGFALGLSDCCSCFPRTPLTSAASGVSGGLGTAARSAIWPCWSNCGGAVFPQNGTTKAQPEKPAAARGPSAGAPGRYRRGK